MPRILPSYLSPSNGNFNLEASRFLFILSSHWSLFNRNIHVSTRAAMCYSARFPGFGSGRAREPMLQI